MPKKKLRAGKGANARLLTQYIKPVPHRGEKRHRTEVVLVKKGAVDKKEVYYFKLAGESSHNNDVDQLHYATPRWFKILGEGSSNVFFKEQPPEQQQQQQQAAEKTEPKTKWKNSEARRILYAAVYDGKIPRHAKDENGKPTKPTLEEIYQSNDEYKKYNRKFFSARLRAIRQEVNGRITRRDEDYEALKKFIENVPVSRTTWQGFIHWHDSESRALVQKDIESGLFNKIGYRRVYESRTVYQSEFPEYSFFIPI
jgi:hypothetical protein